MRRDASRWDTPARVLLPHAQPANTRCKPTPSTETGPLADMQSSTQAGSPWRRDHTPHLTLKRQQCPLIPNTRSSAKCPRAMVGTPCKVTETVLRAGTAAMPPCASQSWVFCCNSPTTYLQEVSFARRHDCRAPLPTISSQNHLSPRDPEKQTANSAAAWNSKAPAARGQARAHAGRVRRRMHQTAINPWGRGQSDPLCSKHSIKYISHFKGGLQGVFGLQQGQRPQCRN